MLVETLSDAATVEDSITVPLILKHNHCIVSYLVVDTRSF